MKFSHHFAAAACRPRFLMAAYFYVASFSLMTGAALFANTLRWFPIADLLRSMLLDLLFLTPLLVVPWASLPYLLLLYPFLAAACISNVMHIVLYHSTISTFAIQSVMETTAAEATEFVSDFLGLKTAFIVATVTLIPLILLRRAARTAKRDTLTKKGVILTVVLLLSCLGVASTVVRKGDRLLRSHGAYLLLRTWADYKEEIAVLNQNPGKQLGTMRLNT